MTALVRYDLADGVARITMDDGKANLMTQALFAELHDALDQAEREAAVVVLTGRDRMFSGGYDRAMFLGSPEHAIETVRQGGELALRLAGFATPVLAAVGGHAVAQGAFVAMCADTTVGLRGEAKIGFNEVAIGLTIPWYGIELCRHRLTPSAFLRLTATGPLIGGEEAHRVGILDHLVAAEEFDATVAEEATRLATLQPDAQRATKARVREPLLAAMRTRHRAEYPPPGDVG